MQTARSFQAKSRLGHAIARWPALREEFPLPAERGEGQGEGCLGNTRSFSSNVFQAFPSPRPSPRSFLAGRGRRGSAVCSPCLCRLSCGSPCNHVAQALLLVAAWLLAANLSLAVEPWTDARLPVTNGLLLWFDASRQNAARGAGQFPPLTDGTACDYWFDGSGHECHLSQRIATFRPRFHQTFTAALLHFDGKDDFLAASKPPIACTNTTVFILAAPRANPGDFRAIFAFNQAGRNDFTTGLNLDLGPFPTPQFSFLNAEGAGFGGAVNLMPAARFGFGVWHSFAVTCQPGANGVQVFMDGQVQGSRGRAESVLRLDEFTLGARCYSNTPEPPHTQGFLECDIAEFIAFNRLLAENERAAVEKYLAAKYAALRALPPASPADGSHPLVTVTNSPP